jgi:translation elongation factor P/translation initiation factor 5A
LTGALWEHSFRAELKLEEVAVEKHPLTFLYCDQEQSYFLNPISFEPQIHRQNQSRAAVSKYRCPFDSNRQ